MKNIILLIENLCLAIQIAIFCIFIFFTIFSVINSSVSISELEFLLIVSLVYFFGSILKSVVFSKILKLDLSYKGPNIFEYVHKVFKLIWFVVFLIIAIISLIYKIHYYFILASIVNCFSITLQFSIIKYFKIKG